MEFDFLANKLQHLPQIAKWYANEWGFNPHIPHHDALTTKLRECLNTNALPLIILALKHNRLLGAAQLKFHEMDIYPDKHHWLGGVYIDQTCRNQGIGKKLITQAIKVAKQHKVSSLYLQTENLAGGLYTQLGWRAIEQVNYHNTDVLVMEKTL